MANELVIADTYYNRTTAVGYGYRDFVENLSKSQTKEITAAMRENSNREIAAAVASAGLVAESVQQMQTGITTAISGQTEVMQAGFGRITNELGRMSVEMSQGFARTEAAIGRLSVAVCNRLDKIANILENPRGTAVRELYNNALTNYRKGYYEEALPDIQKAVETLTTDYLSWFLAGEIYAFGAGKFSNVVDLDKSIAAYTNAAKYINSDAEKSEDAKLLAAEIHFYLGLAQYAKSNELFRAGDKAKSDALLSAARDSFTSSYQYSDLMLEARYNAARCKALLGNASGALADLEAVIKGDALYCVKAEIESDFDVIRGDYHRLIEKMRDEMHEKFEPVYQEIVRGYRLAQQENLTQYFEKSVRFIPATPQNSTRRGITSSGAAGYGIGLITGATIPLFEQCISAGFDKSLPYLDMWQRTLLYPALLNVLKNGADAVFQTRTNDNGSVTIINYAGKDTQVVIPASIGGKPVTIIGEKAFEKKQLTSVKIPGSVTSIGYSAFSENQLTSVVIPGGVKTIGTGAFFGNQLTSVEIPDSVITIGNEAFQNNRLTSAVIGSGVTSISEYAFTGNQLTSVEIPASVKTIGTGAFSGNQLTRATIGNGVTSIGEYAFFGNRLTEVVIPNSVTSIGKYAFSGQDIYTITIGANVNVGDWGEAGGKKTCFDSAYSEHGKKAGKYVPRDLSRGKWTRHAVTWKGKGKAKEVNEDRLMTIGSLLGFVPLIGGFVVGHWFIGIILGLVTAGVGAVAFTARGWGILALALIGGSIALGIQVGHPVILGIIGVLVGLGIIVAKK